MQLLKSRHRFYNTMLPAHAMYITILLLATSGVVAKAQLLKALGNLIGPALNLLTPPSDGSPFPGGSDKVGVGASDRHMICRNTIDGREVCGFSSGPASKPHFDDGTPFPQATGVDQIFPADCGRNLRDGTGKLCFPDGILCQLSKFFTWVS